MEHNEFIQNNSENTASVNSAATNADVQANTAPEINAASINPANPAAEATASAQAQTSIGSEPQRSSEARFSQQAQSPASQAAHTGGYNPYANADEPAVHQNSYQQPQNSQPQHDFSRYQNTASHYTQIPPQETVYINNQPNPQKQKKQKASGSRLSIKAVACVVAICMVFSGGAAFAGTYFANQVTGTNTPSVGGSSQASSGPSVVFQSYTNDNKTQGTYVQVAEAVTPTVVEITTESISTSTTFWGGNYVTSGAGSGVIISADGMIITNAHVVSGANTIQVKLKDGTAYAAELVGIDSDSDVAVIKVDGSDLPFALIGDSDTLKVGEEVVAVGNPLGELGGTVTNGIVSALSRDVSINGAEMTLIQTNAAVNPGNSGGGLFNLYGELIGVVNAKSTSTSSGTSVEGIGFAIPVNTAVKVASELVNYGYVRGKVMLGINYKDISSSYEAMYYGVNALGMYITSADTDELQSGDRVTALDGVEITYSSDLKALLKNYEVGDEVTLTVVRKGKYVDVKITLKEYVPDTASETTASNSSFESNYNKQTAG